jgi:hypothetical protein
MDPDERDTGKGETGAGAGSGEDRSADAWAEVTDAVSGAARASGASGDGHEARGGDGAPGDGEAFGGDDMGASDPAGGGGAASDAASGSGDGSGRSDPWARLGEEARRLAESLTGQEGAGGGSPSGARLAEEARRLAESLVGQAEAVREQVARRHPEVAAHLAAAGTELASAYRAFVGDRERRWAARPAEKERIRLDEDE